MIVIVQEGSCRYSSVNKAGRCSGFWILPRNESTLMFTVAKFGPVSVGINAKLASFHSYKSGEEQSQSHVECKRY